MKPPSIIVHFTQTETTNSTRCSQESLKKQLKVTKSKFKSSLHTHSTWLRTFKLYLFMAGRAAPKQKPDRCHVETVKLLTNELWSAPKNLHSELKYISLNYHHGHS